MTSLASHIALCLLLLEPIQADKFSTLADMEYLLETQVKVIRHLEQFVTKERKRIQFLETYLNRCKTEYSRAIEDVPYYLGNPINAFTIIKRLSTDLNYVENVIKDKSGCKRIKNLSYPTKEDLNAALFGFARIQTTYHLNISDLAKGILSESFSRNNDIYKEIVAPLSTSDCYYIGNVSFNNDYFKEAIEWWVQAWNKFNSEGCDLCPFTEAEVLDRISQTYYILGDINNTIAWINAKIALDPNSQETAIQIQFVKMLQRKMARTGLKEPIQNNVHSLEDLKDFTELCQGKVNMTFHFRLKCVYATGSNPVLSLMRVKTEEMHRKPDIIMIHDVMSDAEIRKLMGLSKILITKNGTFGNVKKNSEVNYRNAKSVNLENVTSEVVDQVTRRLALFTDINMENSEPLKIIHYGLGGMYENHFDCNTVGKAPLTFFQKNGDRIATMMIYLTNVAQGGATIFPVLRLAIFPKKGAALFWMNLLPSGERDDAIIHAACPVLKGSKWIAIKWAHEVPQKSCPVWQTRRGLMNKQMYDRLAVDIHRSRTERLLQKTMRERNILRRRKFRDEL